MKKEIVISKRAFELVGEIEIEWNYIANPSKWHLGGDENAVRAKIRELEDELKSELAKLTEELDNVQKRCSARTITAREIFDELVSIENKLGIAKCHMNGIRVTVDLNARSFPNAYKYIPESTHFNAELRSGKWRITDIRRAQTLRPTVGHNIELTEEAKEAIIKSLSCY